MTTTAWALGRGVEILDTPDALLGHSERGGEVKLARFNGVIVAVKIVEGVDPTYLAALSALPRSVCPPWASARACTRG